MRPHGVAEAGRKVRYITVTFALYFLAMARTKISTLNLRIDPAVKSAVRQAAAREHRSVANMVEVLIRRHCDQAGISISGSERNSEATHG